MLNDVITILKLVKGMISYRKDFMIYLFHHSNTLWRLNAIRENYA